MILRANRQARRWSLACALALAACGGDAGRDGALDADQLAAQEAGTPRASGDIAADGIEWIRYRRQQAGLAQPLRHARLDAAALGHALYQQRNNRVTHEQLPQDPGFTGASAPDRLRAAGYPLDRESVADGEVIAATAAADGFAAADGLFGAIYHRYLLLQPEFDRIGAGSAQRAGGYHWLTVSLVATLAAPRLGTGQLAVWPAPGQRSVRPNFYSDQETPDPVPGRDEVGYPVSVHADLGAELRVERFALREPGGAELPVTQLDGRSDRATPSSAAAIIPVAPLRSNVQYEATFSGTLDGVAVARSWTFRTR